MFNTPEDSAIVWRYLDFEKFVDLILNQELFFCRSDKFDDPYEGYLQLKGFENNPEILTSDEKTKKFYFLNCWHINELQSDAMWRIFLKTNNGIAIKTTVGRIKNSLEKTPDDVFIGKVYYRDFDEVTFTDLLFEEQNKVGEKGGSMSQFNYKRISFEHERELRLFYIDMPIPHAVKDGIPRDPIEHKKVKVNVDALIDLIVISPFADPWFGGLLERLVKKLEINAEINYSNLYKLKNENGANNL